MAPEEQHQSSHAAIMSDKYPLHYAVFHNQVRELSQYLRTHDAGQKDPHGKLTRL